MFCTIKDHQKSLKYCLECYQLKRKTKQVFYCSRCHLSIHKIHSPHSFQIKSLCQGEFMNSIKQIKDIMNIQIRQIQRTQKKNISQQISQNKLFFYKLLQSDNFKQTIIQNQQFLTWLIKIGCLTVTKTQKLQKIKQSIIPYIRHQLSVKQNVSIVQFQQSEFKIEWNKVEQTNIDKQLKLLIQEKINKIKQNQICQFVSQSFSLYSNIDNCMQKSIKKCDYLIKKYPKSKILYLAKIRLYELLPNKNKQIINILNKIIQFQKQFSSTDLYYYYKSLSHWQILDNQRQQKQDQQKIFLQLKNKKYYKLINSTQYINDLKKAIMIKKKPVYYVNLAIGYIVQGKFQLALECFEKGFQYQNDSYDLNKIWVQIQQNNLVDVKFISQNLETRTIQFIVNLCRYFKKNKKYSQLLHFCSVILNKQPDNQKIKIQFVKAIIYCLDSKKIQFDDVDLNKLQTAEEIIQQLKHSKIQQANLLQMKLLRMKAKKQLSNEQKINEASQIFGQIINLSNSSSSDYYNYACSLFLIYLRQNDEDILRQSRQIINKAIQMKTKVKFQKLKFFIQCYMNEFNSANKILQNQQQQLINHQAYQQLIEFIRSNID